MDEIIQLETTIRAALPIARSEVKKIGPFGKSCMPVIDDAEAIMRGKPTFIAGTRLERLRILASAIQSMATSAPFTSNESFEAAYLSPWSKADADPNWDGHLD